MKKIFLSLALLSLINVGCQGNLENSFDQAQIIISRDFGREVISQRLVDIQEGTALLDVMEENFQVETAYGGSFINSIDELQSGFTGKKNHEKLDWFFYVNGILSQIGSGDYELNPEDLIVWDYHDWDKAPYLSSIVGAYPSNFVKGYGTPLELKIMCSEGYEDEGENLKEYLSEEGVSNVVVSKINDEILKEGQSNIMVIGLWEDISKHEQLKEIYDHREKSGLFFEIGDDIKVLNQNGEIAATYEQGAVMVSVLNGYDVMSTIWLITGNEEKDIKESARLLYKNPDAIRGMFSVFVSDNQLIKLPFIQ